LAGVLLNRTAQRSSPPSESAAAPRSHHPSFCDTLSSLHSTTLAHPSPVLRSLLATISALNPRFDCTAFIVGGRNNTTCFRQEKAGTAAERSKRVDRHYTRFQLGPVGQVLQRAGNSTTGSRQSWTATATVSIEDNDTTSSRLLWRWTKASQ
jgi:hypothetical protein